MHTLWNWVQEPRRHRFSLAEDPFSRSAAQVSPENSKAPGLQPAFLKTMWQPVFTPMYIPLSVKTSKGFHFLIKGSQFWCLRTTLGLIYPSFHATASTPCQHLPTDYCSFLWSAFLPFSPCPVFHLPQSCQQSKNISLMSYSTLYLLGKHTDWNCLLWLGTIVTTCRTNFTTGGHSKEHRTNMPPTTEEFGKGQKEILCVLLPPRILLVYYLPESFSLASILAEQCMSHQEGLWVRMIGQRKPEN